MSRLCLYFYAVILLVLSMCACTDPVSVTKNAYTRLPSPNEQSPNSSPPPDPNSVKIPKTFAQLKTAIENNDQATLKDYLETAGSNPNLCGESPCQQSLLSLSVINHRPELLNLLLRHGANSEGHADELVKPLQHAFVHSPDQLFSVAKILLKNNSLDVKESSKSIYCSLMNGTLLNPLDKNQQALLVWEQEHLYLPTCNADKKSDIWHLLDINFIAYAKSLALTEPHGPGSELFRFIADKVLANRGHLARWGHFITNLIHNGQLVCAMAHNLELYPQYVDLLKHVIDNYGIDVNLNCSNKSLLSLAIRGKQQALVRHLIDTGADVDGLGAELKKPLNEAIENNSWQDFTIVKWLIERGASYRHLARNLFSSAFTKPNNAITAFFDAGVDINTPFDPPNSNFINALTVGRDASLARLFVDQGYTLSQNEAFSVIKNARSAAHWRQALASFVMDTKTKTENWLCTILAQGKRDSWASNFLKKALREKNVSPVLICPDNTQPKSLPAMINKYIPALYQGNFLDILAANPSADLDTRKRLACELFSLPESNNKFSAIDNLLKTTRLNPDFTCPTSVGLKPILDVISLDLNRDAYKYLSLFKTNMTDSHFNLGPNNQQSLLWRYFDLLKNKSLTDLNDRVFKLLLKNMPPEQYDIAGDVLRHIIVNMSVDKALYLVTNFEGLPSMVINFTDAQQRSPLHHTYLKMPRSINVWSRPIEHHYYSVIAGYLIGYGANINALDKDNKKPKDYESVFIAAGAGSVAPSELALPTDDLIGPAPSGFIDTTDQSVLWSDARLIAFTKSVIIASLSTEERTIFQRDRVCTAIKNTYSNYRQASLDTHADRKCSTHAHEDYCKRIFNARFNVVKVCFNK